MLIPLFYSSPWDLTIAKIPALSGPANLGHASTTAANSGSVREIAQAEGLDGQPVSAYVQLVQRHDNNFRAVLQSIEAGEMLVGITNASN